MGQELSQDIHIELFQNNFDKLFQRPLINCFPDVSLMNLPDISMGYTAGTDPWDLFLFMHVGYRHSPFCQCGVCCLCVVASSAVCAGGGSVYGYFK